MFKRNYLSDQRKYSSNGTSSTFTHHLSEREPGFDHIAYGIDEEGKDVIKITNLKGKETHTTVDKVLKPDVQ